MNWSFAGLLLAGCSIPFGRREASEDKIDNEIRWRLQLASRQDRADHEPAAQDVEPFCQIWKRPNSSAPRSKSGNVKSISRN